jgi:acyl-CoA thioester hydrolase
MDAFFIEKTIYYHDTDCGGVVYYANYLKYMEEARTEYFRTRGIELPKLAEDKIWFVVARVEIEYKSPARYQDRLRIFVRVEGARLSTIKFSHEIRKGEKTVARSTTTLVCVGGNFRPTPLPEQVKKSLKSDLD